MVYVIALYVKIEMDENLMENFVKINALIIFIDIIIIFIAYKKMMYVLKI